MFLENPAVTLNIGVQDVMGLLEKVLKERHWKHFEVASFKLVYIPYYVFNFDVLVEQDVGGQPFSQSSSGMTALDAITGKLEPLLAQILEKQPVTYEKEISHELKYELFQPAIQKSELADAARVKLAGQFNVKKENLAVSGFRPMYWPIWRIFVTLPDGTQRIHIEAVAGYPLNIEEVPVREKGWIEVTQDTIDKMKTPEGWKDLFATTAKAAAAGVKTVATKQQQGEAPKASAITYWLFHTREGRYSLLLIAVLAAVLLLLNK